jgi:hypothetical protein
MQSLDLRHQREDARASNAPEKQSARKLTIKLEIRADTAPRCPQIYGDNKIYVSPSDNSESETSNLVNFVERD